MKNSIIETALTRIPHEDWESSLKIGNFLKLKEIMTINRHYSTITKCEVIGEIGRKMVYVKIRRDTDNLGNDEFRKLGENEYENNLRWYNLFKGSNIFHVVKPLLVYPEQFMFVTEESKGNKLSSIITKHGRLFPVHEKLKFLLKCMVNVGSWLKYKHTLLLDNKKKYSIDDLIDYVDIRLKVLTNAKNLIIPTEYRGKVLNFFKTKRCLVTDEELLVAFNHSDFNPGNILIDKDSVTVLDFGRFVRGSYLLDVSKLYHHLNLFTFKPYFRREVIKKLKIALLEGFGNIDAEKLLMFRFMLIRNTLTHLVNITRFPENNLKGKLYNKWVLHNELRTLKLLIEDY